VLPCITGVQTPVPVKWMALESLTHKVYTIKTDVFVSVDIFSFQWTVIC